MADIRSVLVLAELTVEQRAALESVNPGAVYRYASAGKLGRGDFESVDAIIGNAPPAMIGGSTRLKWMQLFTAGSDAYHAPGAFPPGAVLTNATGGYGLAISEHMLAMLLTLMKRLHQYRDNQTQSLWRDEGVVRSVEGSVTLALGLGDIGGEFARRVKALGSYVIGVRRSNAQKPDYVDELHLGDALDGLLPRADIVALALPGTAETSRILSAERIALLKPGAIVLNVGRGSAIDADALCDALDSGAIAGAGLDVTDPEPLPQDHRMWKTRNVIITPHISGGWHLAQTRERIIGIAIENYRALLAGKPLRSVVDFNRGY